MALDFYASIDLRGSCATFSVPADMTAHNVEFITARSLRAGQSLLAYGDAAGSR